jgi:hypothetical protein
MDKINTRKGSGLDSESQRHGELAFISDDSIMHEFVTPQMMAYFGAKLPNVKLNTLTHRICELLKYLILTSFSPGRILFGTDVDDVWHYLADTTVCATLRETSWRDLPPPFLRGLRGGKRRN